jgi:hypothetical protein
VPVRRRAQGHSHYLVSDTASVRLTPIVEVHPTRWTRAYRHHWRARSSDSVIQMLRTFVTKRSLPVALLANWALVWWLWCCS